jgi:proline iminopeptidase
VTTPRDRFLAFRRSLARPPRLTRHHVRARGLDFAVFTSPPVPGALPLLCINGGLLFDHNLLWPALSPLAGHRQLVLYDQRGRGESQAPPGVRAARIEHDAGDVPALRTALGIDRWDVLGHSWGGGIAMLAVAQDQAATRRLVLVDAVGTTSAWLGELHDRALARLSPAQRASLDAAGEVMARGLAQSAAGAGGGGGAGDDPAVASDYSRAFYPAWFADAELAAMFSPPRSASRTGAAVSARLRREGYDWRHVVADLNVATLVIHGERDVLPVEVARRTAALLPQARLTLIPDAGHMPFWEAPQTFFPAVDAFLNERDQ